jgi:histidinol-phosphate aminotransferase
MSDVLRLARPEIVALAAYSPARWDPALVRLHANENPWRGASDRSRAGLNRYPEPQSRELIARLAALYGVAAEQVLVGRGSDEGIDLLVRAFCRAGQDQVLVCPPTFAMYRFAADVQGAGVVEVPLRRDEGFSLDADAVLAAATPATRLVFLCSPNNPTGNLLERGAVERVIEGLAGRAVVVVDEAYVEFSSAGSLVPWLSRYPHLAILRTLSKAYGLAGLRVGFGLAHPEVAELMNRVRQPFNVNHLAMVAACAALGDEAFIAESRRVNAEGLEQLARGFRRLGLEFIPSAGNFIAVRVGDAARVYSSLLREGVIVRPVAGYGMPEHLRVTVGTAPQNERFLAALGRALEGA